MGIHLIKLINMKILGKFHNWIWWPGEARKHVYLFHWICGKRKNVIIFYCPCHKVLTVLLIVSNIPLLQLPVSINSGRLSTWSKMLCLYSFALAIPFNAPWTLNRHRRCGHFRKPRNALNLHKVPGKLNPHLPAPYPDLSFISLMNNVKGNFNRSVWA